MIISRIGHNQSWWFESNVYEWQNAVSDNFGCAKFLKMLNICKLVIKVVKMVNFDQKLIFKFLICFFVMHQHLVLKQTLHEMSSFWPILDFWLNFEIGEHSIIGTRGPRNGTKVWNYCLANESITKWCRSYVECDSISTG